MALPNLEIGKLLATVVDLHHELVGQCLIAIGDDLDTGFLGNAGKIRQRHGGEGRELDLAGFQRLNYFAARFMPMCTATELQPSRPH